jgi:receptor-type tyrosine-protein phosphatase epsilon
MLDKDQIKKEFSQLTLKLKQSTNPMSFKTALLPENKKKNRYPNVLPNESCRVHLSCNKCHSTKCTQTCYSCQEENYINSNYVSTPLSENYGRFFIATQCPIPNTYETFWRMIWQKNVGMIFMLGNFVEDGVLKCNQYFPVTPQEIQYGSFKVRLNAIYDQHLLVREFTIKNMYSNEPCRKLYQVHYTRWPDHGVPEMMDDVLSMIQIAENFFIQYDSPIVVHCSAGIGRTGTFISIFNCINALRLSGECNIMNTVEKLRQERHGSVTRESQYEFIYSAVLHYINGINIKQLDNNVV